MRIEAIAWFDMPNNGKWHGQSVMPQQELVRCKDCKYSSPNQVYGCMINSFADDLDKRMYSDDFCSMAERKEE